MMEAIKRLGIAYGKLGLSTDAELIGRRGEGVKAAAGDLRMEGIGPLVMAAFGVGSGDGRFAFLQNISTDPTFDVQPADREALLLAGAVAEYEIENGTDISADLALAVVTCACGGLRQPPLGDQLVVVARNNLAYYQGQGADRPKDRTHSKIGEEVTGAIEAIGPTQHFTQAAPNVKAALQAVSTYAESVASAAASSDQEILGYVRRLEQEMRTYWWVAGGWSDALGKPFRQLPLAVAAVCAGKELADKHPGPVGLFAAPALIDLVLERGRTDSVANVALQAAAVSPDRDWRGKVFGEIAAGQLAALMPVTAALGLAAASEDADDWKPRFKRLTGLEPDATLPAPELGVQLYRECLLARSLG
ncbi:MAG: hypothetical protein KIT82_18680 [Bradyrhizobium sp.]|nr:hypothetical protein [Bradyrhizobium sp.]